MTDNISQNNPNLKIFEPPRLLHIKHHEQSKGKCYFFEHKFNPS